MRLGLEQHQQLSREQKLEFKRALELRQEFVTEAPPEAKRGLEGVHTADQMLKQKGLRGLLIGGVAEDLWKRGKQSSDLESHKDVDVLVIEQKPSLIERFENGIDWWKTNEQVAPSIVTSTGISIENARLRWHNNGNNVVLYYDLRTEENYVDESHNFPKEPGLYIPDSSVIADMKTAELVARATFKGRVIDTDVEHAIKKRLAREIGKTLMADVVREFGSRIIVGNRVGVHGLDSDHYRVIKERLETSNDR